jgi:hypothetical protein
MKKIRVKKIKICCEMMKDYINHTVKVFNGHAVLDSAIYEENPIDIDYCPWCGKKIEYKHVYVKVKKVMLPSGMPVPSIWSKHILEEMDKARAFNKPLKFNHIETRGKAVYFSILNPERKKEV